MESLIELLKLTLPGGLILYAAYLMVRAFIGKEQKLWHARIQEERVKVSLPLRLQAYERMCLFLERSTVSNLVVRLSEAGLSAKELHYMMLKEIREEFNHNFSQQIYLSTEAWKQIQAAVEETISLINQSADPLPPEATHTELVKQIMQQMSTQKYDSTAHALHALKEEVLYLF